MRKDEKTANRTLSIRRALARIMIVLLPIMPVLAQQQSQDFSANAPVESSPIQPGICLSPVTPGLASAGCSAPHGGAGSEIVTLAGKGEMNDLERHVMAPLVIEVLDQNERPVEGAEVVFRFPINGPGAVFPGGKTSQTARTNGQGSSRRNELGCQQPGGSFRRAHNRDLWEPGRRNHGFDVERQQNRRRTQAANGKARGLVVAELGEARHH